MEHVNGWCFRGIYKGGLWENDLHVSAHDFVSLIAFASQLIFVLHDCLNPIGGVPKSQRQVIVSAHERSVGQ